MEPYPSVRQPPFDFGWPAGAYRISTNAATMTTNALSTSAEETFQPFYIPRRVNLVALAFPLVTQQSGAECRLGLYRDNNGTPTGGALIVDAGTIDLSSGTGTVKDTSAIDIWLDPGWIWTCCQMKNVATQASAARNAGGAGYIAPTTAAILGAAHMRYLVRSITYGSALAASGPSGLTASSSGANGVMIALKSAA